MLPRDPPLSSIWSLTHTYAHIRTRAHVHPPPLLQVALTEYAADVAGRRFPTESFSPYKLPPDETVALAEALAREGMGAAAAVVAEGSMGCRGVV
jgi:hypothetical protein